MRGYLVSLGLLCALAAGARADDAASARAKALFTEGTKQYNLGRFQDALAAFDEGYLAKAAPEFLFNIGQCHRMLGHWKEEIHAYRRFLAERPNAPNRADLEKYIAQAEAELAKEPPTAPAATTGKVTIESTPSGAEVRLDDENAPPVGKTPYTSAAMVAGAHVVFLSFPDYQRAMKAFKVGAGESVRLDVALARLEAPPTATTSTPAPAASAPAPAPDRSTSRVHFVAQAGGGLAGGSTEGGGGGNGHELGMNGYADLWAGIEIDLVRWLSLRAAGGALFWTGEGSGQAYSLAASIFFWPVEHWYVGLGGGGADVAKWVDKHGVTVPIGLVGESLFDTGVRFLRGRMDVGVRLSALFVPNGFLGALGLYLGVRLP